MEERSGWMDILSAHPEFEADDEFASLVKRRFGDVDLEAEAVKFMEWLTGTKKGRSRTKIRSTFLNWLKNTRRFSSRRRGHYNRYTDPSLPVSYSPGSRY